MAYAAVLGGYAEERLIAADRLVKLPPGIDEKTAAAMMLQGMTVRYLLRETYPCTAKTVMLFHAAAGGVGLIACQWARAIGATMIGTVGSEEKARLAKEHGCTHVINYRTEDFVARVKEITQGEGCDVVYDSVGKDTFPSSLDCLKPKGLWVSFGSSSGPVPPFDIAILSAKGSLYATRPTLMTYTARRADLLANAADLFDMVGEGRGQDRRQPHLSAARSRRRAPRSRGAQDDGLGRAHPVTPTTFRRVWLARGNHDREGAVAGCFEADRLRHFDAIARRDLHSRMAIALLASARAVYQFSSAR